jgi:hypothetical protein
MAGTSELVSAGTSTGRDGLSAKEDEGGVREVTASSDRESRPVPSGDQIGALNLEWNGFELTSFGTEGSARVSQSFDLTPTPKSLLDKTFGSEWHPLAPNASAPQMADSEVRPEGFEPPTLGSEVAPRQFLQVFPDKRITHSSHCLARTYATFRFRRFRVLSPCEWAIKGTSL